MSTLTKEWLLKTMAELEEERDATPSAVNEDAAMALAAMKLELASLESEPYGYVHKAAYEQAGSCGLSSDHEAYRDSSTHIAVYTAPPAPVAMKDHQIRDLVNELRDIAVEYYGTQQLRERIAKTVRAAMLQGADGNSPVIPDGWVLVPKEPTPDMLNASWVSHGIYHASAYRTMLAAAPQQVK